VFCSRRCHRSRVSSDAIYGRAKDRVLKIDILFRTAILRLLCVFDHGDTFAYEQDVYMDKHFIAEGQAASVSIRQGEQGLYTPNYSTFDLYLVGLPFTPKQLVVDGLKIDFKTDAEGQSYVQLDRDFKKIIIQ